MRGAALTPREKHSSAASCRPRRRSSSPHCSHVRSSRGSARAAVLYSSAERCRGGREAGREGGQRLESVCGGGRACSAGTNRSGQASADGNLLRQAAHLQLPAPLLKRGPLPPVASVALGELAAGAKGGPGGALLQQGTSSRHTHGSMSQACRGRLAQGSRGPVPQQARCSRAHAASKRTLPRKESSSARPS